MKMWSAVGNRIASSVRESSNTTAQSIKSLSPVGEGHSTNTTVYSWVDAQGTTHYSSHPPAGVEARSMSISSSRNVVAPTYAPEPNSTSASSFDTTPRTVQTSGVETELGGELPGIAGMNLPMDIKPEDLGLDRDELLKLLPTR